MCWDILHSILYRKLLWRSWLFCVHYECIKAHLNIFQACNVSYHTCIFFFFKCYVALSTMFQSLRLRCQIDDFHYYLSRFTHKSYFLSKQNAGLFWAKSSLVFSSVLHLSSQDDTCTSRKSLLSPILCLLKFVLLSGPPTVVSVEEMACRNATTSSHVGGCLGRWMDLIPGHQSITGSWLTGLLERGGTVLVHSAL